MEATERKKWKRGGPPRPAAERFWEKVNKTESCWIWMAALASGGYGSFMGDRGSRRYKAHRWAWEQEHGPVPEGMDLDHLCRNRACVRPDHLEPVTRRENLHRGAGTPSRTACPKGHPYDEQNTCVTTANGWRLCRTCARERMAAKRATWTPEQVEAKRKADRDRYHAKKAAS